MRRPRFSMGSPLLHSSEREPLCYRRIFSHLHASDDISVHTEHSPGKLSRHSTPYVMPNLLQRSGLVGCLSFTLVSLAEYNAEGRPSPATRAAFRGAAMVVGVVASVVVNWVLWPFVARHDLRRGISSMLFYCSVIYRSKSCILELTIPLLTYARYRVPIRVLRSRR